ncbi:MAG: (1-_4)-alpha-D-glucan 1-alpha-D-glucosylmutase [Frankiales bacterium]|jgi:(1->4)-alpha-D-glucan 1-alpha-D-glucosylmutase|nr:(1->4)-alpha-D-glucan 1-alpha-D-glucosylmutase [Frankiales bacterium]
MTPTATYRLQLTPTFTFADAASVVPYLAALGVSHVYCSPVLQAAPGSQHGYDVVDHQQLNIELGGAEGFALLVAACREHHLGIVIDVVPNHMHVGAPEDRNVAWFDLLRRGRNSAFATWFDVDWDAPGLHGKIVIPVLDDDPQVLADRGELVVDGDTLRLRDHVWPLAEGTTDKRLPELLAAQHYRLAHWREGNERLNYRRFFDVNSLAGVRVEDASVLGATHHLLLRYVRADVITGLRVDHPDGLADPTGYLDELSTATDNTWVVVEKILERDESLPDDWRCAGTTGYDALNVILGLLIDTSAAQPLTRLYADRTGQEPDWNRVVERSKRDVVSRLLRPELGRLARLAAASTGEPIEALEEAFVELLVPVPVYRAYVRPGHAVPEKSRAILSEAAAIAARRSDRPDLIERVRDLLLAGPPELVIRFQQTTGPVMAKGVEDTACYRYARLVALNEVGGDPGHFGRTLEEFHAFATHLATHWPSTMTALSTHDTKRSEDIRARLAVISEIPDEWAAAVSAWSDAAATYRSPVGPDRNAEYFLWQTLVGAWPLSRDRALQYAEKATREAKQYTSWLDHNPAYDTAVSNFVEQVLADQSITGAITAFVQRVEPAARVNRLTQKIVQLTMPGVPDIYQGTEMVDLSLVDPDNRRPVDFDARRKHLDAGDDEKLHVVATALRARRDYADCFSALASYRPVRAVGPAADHVIAFQRGDGAVTIATRLSERLRRDGGWRDTAIPLAAGPWTDLLSGRSLRGDGVEPIDELLDELPVALLGRTVPTHS